MFTLTDPNPWTTTDEVPRAARALADLHKARARCETLAAGLPALRAPLTRFAADIAVIARAYEVDVANYRRTRALTAVHIPAILSALDTLQDLRDAQADASRIAAIETQLTACLSATVEARRVIEDHSLSTLEIAATVAQEQIVGQSTKPTGPSEPEQTGLLGRLRNQGVSIGARIGSAPSAAMAQVAEAQSALGERLSGGVAYASTTIAGALADGMERITSPVQMRLRAASTAFAGASVSALVNGLLVSLIFPPAAPLMLGLAAIEAPDLYNDAMREQTVAAARARQDRRAARDEETARALARLRGESPVVRMETPWLHVRIDLAAGEAEGIVLAGRHTGQSLANLTEAELTALRRHAPDSETAQILDAWTTRKARQDLA